MVVVFLGLVSCRPTVQTEATTRVVHVQDGDSLIVSRVRVGELDLSEEMVDAGFAWHYVFHSDDATLARLEREAREVERGLWRDREPVPPWDWRRGQR